MEKDETPLKQIRTFQGDVAEALRRERGSLVSIQQAEHLKKIPARPAVHTPSENAKRKTEFFLLFLGSLVLFILGTVGVWYAYNEFTGGAAAPITTAPANRFISADSEINLTLATTSRGDLINTLAGAVVGVAPGEIRHVVLTKGGPKDALYLFPTNEFLAILGTRAPSSLVRAFDPLFMFGAFGKESTFLIIKLSSFENAFAGMLAWEKNMGQDIGPLFATAKFLADLPPGSAFTDIADKNKDIRALASRNQPVLLYSFFDNNMLIITDRIETLRTIIDRLMREKLSR